MAFKYIFFSVMKYKDTALTEIGMENYTTAFKAMVTHWYSEKG